MFVIESDQVHLWWINIDQVNLINDPVQLLSTDERLHTARFRFALDRERWTLARASVRVILGSYLGIPPSSVVFSYNQYGKPEIIDPGTHKGLKFNVSHSEKLCALALTYLDRVGVDAERIRFIPEALGMAQSSFTEYEYQALLAETPAVRMRTFMRFWTKKEAYLKAVGSGLAQTAEFKPRFPDGQILHGSTDNVPDYDPPWYFFEVDPEEHYCASLALCGRFRPRVVTFWMKTLRDPLHQPEVSQQSVRVHVSDSHFN